jgi:hypothetical protein
MKFLMELNLRKALIIFGSCVLFNLIVSFGIYYFFQFNIFKNEAIKMSEYFSKVISEKNIDLKIKKEEIELNADSYLLENTGFPLELNSKNLIYISKNADYADFTDKEVPAILNSKELIIKVDGEFQNIPLASILGNRDEISINKETVKTFVESLDLNGSGFLNTLLGAMGMQKLILYLGEFLWGYFVLTLAIFYLLKFSGYSPEKELIRALAVAYYGVFLVIEVPVTYFKLPLNFIHVFVLGFFTLGLFLKFQLDQKLKQTS